MGWPKTYDWNWVDESICDPAMFALEKYHCNWGFNCTGLVQMVGHTT